MTTRPDFKFSLRSSPCLVLENALDHPAPLHKLRGMSAGVLRVPEVDWRGELLGQAPERQSHSGCLVLSVSARYIDLDIDFLAAGRKHPHRDGP